MGYQIVIVIVAPNRPSCQEVKLVKLQFIALAREMQNAECRMQNERVFYENNFNSCALRTPSFCILHFEFCIRQLQLSAKLQFKLNLSMKKLPAE